MLLMRGGRKIPGVVTVLLLAAACPLAWAQQANTSAQQDGPHATPGQEAVNSQLSPEDLKDLADERAHTPEVALRLKLPELGGVWALDAYDNREKSNGGAEQKKFGNELVGLRQPGSLTDGDTQHYVDVAEVNPSSVAHRLLELKDAAARVQLHSQEPKIYVRAGSVALQDAEPRDYRVETHGAAAEKGTVASLKSEYAIVRLEVRSDVREVNTFRIAKLGVGAQTNVIATVRRLLPGDLWLELKPAIPLDPGEYALVEVLNGHALNREVWAFGVHADAGPNGNVIEPLPDPTKIKPVLKTRPEDDQ
jgi:hypothetical protein